MQKKSKRRIKSELTSFTVVLRIIIPNPDFFPSRISYLESQLQRKNRNPDPQRNTGSHTALLSNETWQNRLF
jgi:hypothetical protein